ncbi:MAG: AAA family ATPase [Arhodomonas sp.]|nr:AAA family ATPase [Arhodomonas sp.]
MLDKQPAPGQEPGVRRTSAASTSAHGEGGDAEPIYIGIHHFFDDAARENVVYDWRAPIATLFYDYETGPARYQSPGGHGRLRHPAQAPVPHHATARIELMIDSAVNVVDDVLQEELGRASDEGMKNIVATIQRDQNAIIRNEDAATTLIIQGVAGSGKTSIALHRIAFLLYRFKDTLSSEDILIISPNRVFADYIANVLPELGEEQVREIGMEALADELLDGQYRFQSFFEQTAALLERRRRGAEASALPLQGLAGLPEAARRLRRARRSRRRFVAEDVWIGRRLRAGLAARRDLRASIAVRAASRERIDSVVREAEQQIGIQYNYDLDARRAPRAAAKRSQRWSRQHHAAREPTRASSTGSASRSCSSRRGGRLEYADVFPLIYLKMRLEGDRPPSASVKHLLIDEMQDYTPVQYAVHRASCSPAARPSSATPRSR